MKAAEVDHGLAARGPVSAWLERDWAELQGGAKTAPPGGMSAALNSPCLDGELTRGLQELRAELSDLRLALKLLPSSVAIVDAASVVSFTSARADALLSKQSRLQIVNGRLTASLPSHAKALAAAILEVARFAHAPHAAKVEPLELELNDQSTVRLSFLPLRTPHGGTDAEARVLVAFLASDDTLKLSPGLIAQLHGLTPTEGLLAAALAEGRTLTQFSAERGCSEQTARVHLRSILQKTGTHRQAELVGVLMRSAALHGVAG